MTEAENELRRRRISNFRHSVVAELGNPYLSRGQLSKMIKTKVEKEYDIPYSKRTRLTEGCIRRWFCLYRKYGKQGLDPKTRNDHGRSRVISDEDQNAIIALLESNNELTAIAAVRKLKEKGVIKNTISSSSLSRFIKAQGLTSNERSRIQEQDRCLKFEFFSPLECVQVDVMYGPEIPDEKGKRRKALLMAFIDDATRRIIYGRFAFSEKSILFEDGIKHILKAQGMVGRLYTDNGSSFVSNQTKRILDILGITLSHSRPGIPKGRGKIERYFRTVRDQFVRPLEVDEIGNIDVLNARFNTWLECEYHRNPHRALKNRMTPLDAWMEKAHHIKPVNLTIDLDQIFLHMHNRKVYKDSTFTLNGTLFETSSILAGKKVTIYFDPHPPIQKVVVKYNGIDYGVARIVNTYANSRVIRSHSGSGNLEPDEPDELENDLPVGLKATNMGGK